MLSPSHIAPKEAGPAPRNTPSERASRARLPPPACCRREGRPPPRRQPRLSAHTAAAAARRRSPPPSLLPRNFLHLARAGRERGRRLQHPAPGARCSYWYLGVGGRFEPSFPSSRAAPVCRGPRGPGCLRAREGDGGTSPHNAQVAGLAPQRRGRARSGGDPRRGAQVPPLPSHPERRDGRCGAVTLLAPVPLPRRSLPQAPSPAARERAPQHPGRPRGPHRAGPCGGAARAPPSRSPGQRGATAASAGRNSSRARQHPNVRGAPPPRRPPPARGASPTAALAGGCLLPPAGGLHPTPAAVAPVGFPSRSYSLPEAPLPLLPSPQLG